MSTRVHVDELDLAINTKLTERKKSIYINILKKEGGGGKGETDNNKHYLLKLKSLTNWRSFEFSS